MVEMIGIYISVPIYIIGTLLLGASVTASLFMFHVAVVPLVFKYSKTFRRSLIFANFGKDDTILHSFPNPDNDMDRYLAWAHAVMLDPSLDPQYVYRNRRVCHDHFEMRYLTWTRRLSPGAIPSLLLPGSSSRVPLIDITNRTENITVDIVPPSTSTSKVQWPLHIDFERPSKSGIEGARNLSLEFDSKVDKCHIKLGIWHILPKSVYERLKGSFEGNVDKEELNRLMDQELANSKTPVMLYCHGNSNSRATSHRILLYKFFQKMEFHTIAFDYRGYGDSTSVCPTESGVVEDSSEVYDWLLNATQRDDKKDSPPIFVWGHSLGTGISSSLLGNMSENKLPRGLILEAPFSNLADEVRHHPLSKLVTWLPYYETTFVEPFRTHREHMFCSDTHLAKTKRLPVLILHAKDDVIVPFRVGLKLYRAIQSSRAEGGAECKLHVYERSEDLGHKYICLARDLHRVVGEFVTAHT